MLQTCKLKLGLEDSFLSNIMKHYYKYWIDVQYIPLQIKYNKGSLIMSKGHINRKSGIQGHIRTSGRHLEMLAL